MHAWEPLKQLFLERTLDEVEAAREWMLLLGRKSAEEKVAALILLVMRRLQSSAYGATVQPTSVRFDLPLSRTEMADYLGLRIETGRGRTVVVRDIGQLERITEVDGADSTARRDPAAKLCK
jgi:CRP/FNR family transcriptional regulator